MGDLDRLRVDGLQVGAVTALEHEETLLSMDLSKRHRVVNYIIQSEQHLGYIENPIPNEQGIDPYRKLVFDLAAEEATRFTLAMDGIFRVSSGGRGGT